MIPTVWRKNNRWQQRPWSMLLSTATTICECRWCRHILFIWSSMSCQWHTACCPLSIRLPFLSHLSSVTLLLLDHVTLMWVVLKTYPFSQCFGLGSGLSWHYTPAIWSKVPTKELRNYRLLWFTGKVLRPKPLRYYLTHSYMGKRDMSRKSAIFDILKMLSHFCHLCFSQCRCCETHKKAHRSNKDTEVPEWR